MERGFLLLREELRASCPAGWLETEEGVLGSTEVCDLNNWTPVFAFEWEGTMGGADFCPLSIGSAGPSRSLAQPAGSLQGILAEGTRKRKRKPD